MTRILNIIPRGQTELLNFEDKDYLILKVFPLKYLMEDNHDLELKKPEGQVAVSLS